jgi:hypothetical protein
MYGGLGDGVRDPDYSGPTSRHRACAFGYRSCVKFMASRLVRLTGTRVGGFVLTREEAAGKRGAATYSLVRTSKA